MKHLFIVAIIYLSGVHVIMGCQTTSGTPDNGSVTDTVFTCMPCGSFCDTIKYKQPGICPHCNMPLVAASSIVHKNMDPQELCILDEEKVLFLDVRTKDEFDGNAEDKFGAIKNAVNIPVQELATRMEELKQFKNRKIIVYCSHSHRSPRASYMLTQNGFKDVVNMSGGMSIWQQQVTEAACNSKLYRKQQ